MIKFAAAILIFHFLLCNGAFFDQDIEGKDCTVTEPYYNHTFNFTTLRSDFGLHKTDDETLVDYAFNICGPLSKKCHGQQAGACMRNKSGSETVLGYADKLYWNDGTIRFSFTGEKCDANNNFTLNVIMHCDYSVSKNDFLGVMHGNPCEINIFFRTPSACLPIPENVKNVNYFVKSPTGEILDFSSLKNSNHRAAGPNGTEFKIGFPILYGHEVACEAGSSICLFNESTKDSSNRYINYGMMTSDFKYELNHISLAMTSKVPCDGDRKYSSRIVFACDNVVGEGQPTFVGTNDCENIFTWPTTLACVEEKPCQVSNVEYGLSFDFRTLAGTQFNGTRPNSTEEVFYFSICSNANDQCIGNAGSCIVKMNNKQIQSTPAGVANNKLLLNGKSPYLLYENGSVCKRAGSKFSTRIDFICADNVNDEGPVLIEDDGCAIVIHFKTLLACINVRNCQAKINDDEIIDLSPLIDYQGNYVATIDTNEKSLQNERSPVQYLLNVCRPLNSFYSLNCHGSAAACRSVDVNGKHENELSLGHSDYSMSAVKEKSGTKVLIKYFHGSECPHDKDENITTLITFRCDASVGLGNPILESIDNCQYSFNFPTNILCPEESLKLDNSSACILKNDKLNSSLDLKALGDSGVYNLKGTAVNMCGVEAKNITIVYKESIVRVEYQLINGSVKNETEIELKCGAADKISSDELFGRIRVMHETPLVCEFLNIKLKNASLHNNSNKPLPDNSSHNAEQPKTGGLSFGYIFLITTVILAFAAFYFVVRNPERREILQNIIRFRSTSSRVRYARVRVNEESALLDNNIGALSDSDDDNILL